VGIRNSREGTLSYDNACVAMIIGRFAAGAGRRRGGLSSRVVEFAVNNREIAVLVWLGGALMFAPTRPDLRAPLWNVVIALCRRVLLGSLAALAAYVAGIVWVVRQTGLWQDDLFTETLVWFITAGFVSWANAHRVTKQRHFVRRTLTGTIALTVFIEGVVNLYVFPLGVELVSVPLLTVLVVLTTFAESEERFASVAKLGNGLLTGIGLVLLGFVALRVATGFSSVDWAHVGRLIVLPVWLGVSIMPAIYGLGLYMAYDSAFRRISFFAENNHCGSWPRRRAKLAVMLGTHFRARAAASFGGPIAHHLTLAASFKEARDIVAAEIAGQRDEDRFVDAMDEAA
jgi:hypothetical protein